MRPTAAGVVPGLLLATCVAVAACEGPMGPQGADGPPGAEGPPGPGQVIASPWFDIEIDEDNSSATIRNMFIEEDRITPQFLNENGLVLMYLKVEEDDAVFVVPLPFLDDDRYLRFFPIDDPSGSAATVPSFRGILFQIASLDGSAVPPTYLADAQLRYVLIFGDTSR